MKPGIVRKGIVLFAHGSRDPEWARPFERIAAALSKRKGFLVRLAYLELMQPSLDTAIADLVASGAGSIRIVPLFFGAGWIYGLGALAGGLHFVRKARALARAPGRMTAMASFFASKA